MENQNVENQKKQNEVALEKTAPIPVDKIQLDKANQLFNEKKEAPKVLTMQSKRPGWAGYHGKRGAIDPLLIALITATFGSAFLTFIIHLT